MAECLLQNERMKYHRLVVIAAIAGVFSAVHATPTVGDLGGSITISDGNYTRAGWYSNHEDNETEANPYTVQGQDWDLEGMYFNYQQLTLVGGFDFRNGNDYANHIYTGGDIFIDTNGDAQYTQLNNGASTLGGSAAGNFGWDYVIHFNSAVTSYSVFQLNSSSVLAHTGDVKASNPWQYVSGGTAVNGYQDVSVQGYGLLTQPTYSKLTTYGSTSVGLTGYIDSAHYIKDTDQHPWDDNHYYLSVNTGFLPSDTLTTFHYTMECGNDNLLGQTRTSVPDSGSTIGLLTAALGALAAVRRRKAIVS